MTELPFTGERFVASLDMAEIAYEHWHRYLFAARLVAGKRVLDVASGEGYGSAVLAEHARDVLGVDVAADAVAHATARYGRANLRFVQASAAAIPAADASFDAVVSFETIEHLPEADQERFLDEVRRVLVRGGVAVLSSPNKLVYSDAANYRNPYHTRELYKEELERALRSRFAHVQLLAQRVHAGSVVWPCDGEGDDERGGEWLIEHGPTGFRPSGPRGKAEKYFVAICSDTPRARERGSALYDLDDRIWREAEASAGRVVAKAREALRQKDRHVAELQERIRRLEAALRDAAGQADVADAAASHAGAITPPGAGGVPLVSIVIPVFNKADYTARCLEAIARNTPGELFEVVIVDNASTDETPALLGALGGDVQVIRNAENAGFVGACNQGAAAARGRYLLFLNNDTQPQEGWLEALLRAFQRDPAIGGAGARLVYPDGRLQEAGGLVFRDGSGWNFGRGDPEPFRDRYNVACEVDYCSGAALMVRRDLFQRLGGFDARYAPAYYEDTDLCFGLRALGHPVVYCPDSIVIHFEGVTAGTDTGTGFKRYQVVNAAKFREKWADALARQDASPAETRRPPATQDRRARGLAAHAGSPGPIGMATRAPAAPAPAVATTAAAGAGPSVLVVDPFLPLHDRASGSKRLFEILKLLRAEDCRVTYVARNGQGQDRYRRELEALGIEVFAGDPERMAALGHRVDAPRVDLAALLARRPYALAWLSFAELAEAYLPLVRAASPRTVVAVDSVDVHFLRERRGAELAGDAAALARARDTEARELAVYGAADVVITVTAADADVLVQHGLGTPIEVVPNVHPAAPPAPGRAKRDGMLFVGNFNHPPNVDAAAWLVGEILPRVRRARPGTALAIVGTNPPAELRALAGPGLTVTGAVPDTGPWLDAAAVSVAPLRYGAGMKGKVGEALARGLPVVTTPIGAEGMALEDGVHALVAPDADAFAAAVVRLLGDAALWCRLAEAGRRHVEARYGVEPVAARVRALLARAVVAAGRPAAED